MAISPNVLAGLAAALGGGMKAFNAQTAEDEDKRRFEAQQQHQRDLLQRAITRDEIADSRADLKTKDELTQSAQARALALASNFGGQEVDAATLQDVPQHLRGLIAKPVDRPVPLAASTQLTGFASMPGAQKQEGTVNAQDFAAKPAAQPGERFEIQVPNSERVRLQELRDQGALTRAQLLGGQRSGQLEQQNQQFYDKLAQDRELGNQRIMAILTGVAARGQGGRGRALTNQERTAQITSEANIDALDNVRRLYKKEYVGPIQGRASALSTATGLSTPFSANTPELAEFSAAVAKYKNRIINKITGAAVGVKEEQRIMGEIPDMIDPSTTFEAKLKMAQDNEKMLDSLIQARGGRPSGSTSSESTGVEYDWVNGKLVRRGKK